MSKTSIAFVSICLFAQSACGVLSSTVGVAGSAAVGVVEVGGSVVGGAVDVADSVISSDEDAAPAE